MEDPYSYLTSILMKNGYTINNAKRYILRINTVLEKPTPKLDWVLEKYNIPYEKIDPTKHPLSDFLNIVPNIPSKDICNVFGQHAGYACILLAGELQESKVVEVVDSD